MAFYLSMVELKNTTMVNPGDLLWTWPYNHCRYIAEYCRYIADISNWVTQSPLQFPSHHQPRPSRLFTARHARVQLASFPDGPPRPNDPPKRGRDGPPSGAPRCLANLGVPPQMGIYMDLWMDGLWIYGWFMDLWMVYGWFMDGLWDIYHYLSMMNGWFMPFMPSFYPHSCWLLMIWRFPTMGLPPNHLWEKIHKPSSDKGVPPQKGKSPFLVEEPWWTMMMNQDEPFDLLRYECHIFKQTHTLANLDWWWFGAVRKISPPIS